MDDIKNIFAYELLGVKLAVLSTIRGELIEDLELRFQLVVAVLCTVEVCERVEEIRKNRVEKFLEFLLVASLASLALLRDWLISIGRLRDGPLTSTTEG